jgi:hypothetical protein
MTQAGLVNRFILSIDDGINLDINESTRMVPPGSQILHLIPGIEDMRIKGNEK